MVLTVPYAARHDTLLPIRSAKTQVLQLSIKYWFIQRTERTKEEMVGERKHYVHFCANLKVRGAYHDLKKNPLIDLMIYLFNTIKTTESQR
jgi:hypothetical protein